MRVMKSPPPPGTHTQASILTAVAALCVSLVLVESHLPDHQTRQHLPGCVLLAALPHRKVTGERSATTLPVTETVCPNILDVRTAGFTLIELSIVLVIIGLLVGGVLVGRDLISAAAVRAQISQIEKYQQAVNTFRGKYGYLPGDIPDPDASNFGFFARGANPGQGDGNQVIQSWIGIGPLGFTAAGESGMVWVDLSTAKLIPNGLNTMRPTDTGVSNSSPNTYFPTAAMGQNNYIYVWSGDSSANMAAESYNLNYFAVSAVSSIYSNSTYFGGPGMTVAQADSIDKKIDDDMPQKGRVQAQYMFGGFGCSWSMNYTTQIGCSVPSGAIPSFSGNSASCMDNRGVFIGTMYYSTEINNGAGMNCALSFKFQ